MGHQAKDVDATAVVRIGVCEATAKSHVIPHVVIAQQGISRAANLAALAKRFIGEHANKMSATNDVDSLSLIHI